MRKRDVNIRKACDHLNRLAELFIHRVDIVNEVKKITHSIKRTTWRGQENKSSYNQISLDKLPVYLKEKR